MLDTSKRRHLPARCAAPHTHRHPGAFYSTYRSVPPWGSDRPRAPRL